MKRFETVLLAVVICLSALPIASYAETGQKCASDCVETCSGGGTQRDDDIYRNCLDNCLEGCMGKDTGVPDVPPPTPADASETKTGQLEFNAVTEAAADNESLSANLLMASSGDDYDLPCYAGGKYVGNCSRNNPYYSVMSGGCYATLSACKEADGDLSGVSGSGGCVRCGN